MMKRYGFACRNCIHSCSTCEGYMDEHGHCDEYERDDMRADKFGFFKNLLGAIALVSVVFGLYHGIRSVALHYHAEECEGKGKCSWSQCPNYNGSDFLHDLNF